MQAKYDRNKVVEAASEAAKHHGAAAQQLEQNEKEQAFRYMDMCLAICDAAMFAVVGRTVILNQAEFKLLSKFWPGRESEDALRGS